jgi:tRNA G10  N-methylase Trm11
VDVVATDPPYGRATSTMKEPCGTVRPRDGLDRRGPGAGGKGLRGPPPPLPPRRGHGNWCTTTCRRCTARCPATTACSGDDDRQTSVTLTPEAVATSVMSLVRDASVGTWTNTLTDTSP